MAQHFFVRGPSVNPNFGSPATFISGLQDLLRQPATDKVAREKVKADRLFRDQTLAASDRKQDFLEGADARTELKRVNELARDNERGQLVQGISEGAQFAGGDRFTGFESVLSQDARYNSLDDAGKLAARNKFIKNNPSSLTKPKRFAEILRSGLQESGQFSSAQIDAAVSKQIKARYPTADADLIKSQLAKPGDFKIGSGTGTGSSGRGGSNQFSLLNDPTNPDARGTVVDRVVDTFDLPKNPTTIFGVRLDVGDLDATKQDISVALGLMKTKGVNSPTAQEDALNIAFNVDGTVKESFDWRTPAGLNKLAAAGLKAQETEERIFNKRGGGVSGINGGAGVGNSVADIVKATEQYNNSLLARLTPRAQSDQQVITAFLDGLGDTAHGIKSKGTGKLLTDTARQGGQGGDVTPKVVPKPEVTPQPQPTGPAEFQIGGPVEAEGIFNQVKDAVLTSPIKIASEAAGKLFSEGGPASKFIDSLTPPGPGVLTQQPKSTAPNETQLRRDRQTFVDQLTAPERSEALRKAKALSKQRKIGIADADGEGGSRDEALLIAYFKYLEGQGG